MYMSVPHVLIKAFLCFVAIAFDSTIEILAIGAACQSALWSSCDMSVVNNLCTGYCYLDSRALSLRVSLIRCTWAVNFVFGPSTFLPPKSMWHKI